VSDSASNIQFSPVLPNDLRYISQPDPTQNFSSIQQAVSTETEESVITSDDDSNNSDDESK
jgi:hypothetical protein